MESSILYPRDRRYALNSIKIRGWMYLNDCKAIMRFSDVEDTSLNGARSMPAEKKLSTERPKNKNRRRQRLNKGTGSKPPAPVYSDFHGDSTESLRPPCAIYRTPV